MTDFIPYGHQNITEEDIEAVVQVLRSDFLTTGPTVDAFETAASKIIQTPATVAVANATVGLHLAYLTLGLSQGDYLWTVPNTFIATANAARYCGANVDFVDIDPHTFCMDMTALEEKLKQARKTGTLPKIVAPVHFAGLPCDMVTLNRLAKEYHFKIVEDAAHAFGAIDDHEVVGTCALSDACVFSFHPVKIITTGEGGLLSFKDQNHLAHAKALRSHAIEKNPQKMQKKTEGKWYHEMPMLGYNYRMTDISAALGLNQLKTIKENLSYRKEIAHRYHKELASLPITFQTAPLEQSSWHLFVILLEDTSTRKALYEACHHAKIGVQVHYIPVHTQPYYQSLGFREGSYPVSENYASRCLSIPMYHALEDKQQTHVIETIQNFFTSVR